MDKDITKHQNFYLILLKKASVSDHVLIVIHIDCLLKCNNNCPLCRKLLFDTTDLNKFLMIKENELKRALILLLLLICIFTVVLKITIYGIPDD